MSTRTSFDRIQSIDAATASADEVASALRLLQKVTGWASVKQAELTRRLTELEADGAPPATDVLAGTGRSSRRAAAQAEQRAQTYGAVPALEAQRSRGRVSDEHADALSRAAAKLDDDKRVALLGMGAELATRATQSTPGQFARHLGRLIDRLDADAGVDRSERQRGQAVLTHGVNLDTGMGWVRADLHPDDYQRFVSKLSAEVAALRSRPEHEGQRHDQLAAAAFVGLVVSNKGCAVPPPEVAIHIDLETIVAGLHEHSVCEYSDGMALPVETARRHACSADIIPVVLDGEGHPLDLGRARRHATRAQRHALRSMYRTCAIGECDRSFDRCEIHHLAEWDRHQGPTDLDNLLPICTYHHHRAHEGRWRLQLDPSTRQLTVHLPNGMLHSQARPDLLTERVGPELAGGAAA